MDLILKHKAPIIVIAGWIAALILLANVLGCDQTNPVRPPQDTHEFLIQATGELTAAFKTVKRSIDMGILKPESPQYADLYEVLEKAKTTMDTAWEIYRQGNLPTAQQTGDAAMSIYAAIRPQIAKLAEAQ